MKEKQTKIKTKKKFSQLNKQTKARSSDKMVLRNFIKTKLSTSHVYLKTPPKRDLIYSSNNRRVWEKVYYKVRKGVRNIFVCSHFSCGIWMKKHQQKRDLILFILLWNLTPAGNKWLIPSLRFFKTSKKFKLSF